MSSKSVFFPNLNALRFIAAALVVVHHIEQGKSMLNIPSLWATATISKGFKSGLILFFVLSGFLITNLLLIEKSIAPKINIRNFYIRRILRIWPLYFLIIGVAYCILPYFGLFRVSANDIIDIHTNFVRKIILFIIILPNVVVHLNGGAGLATHTWSIGAEEQFYVIWPAAMRYLKNIFLFVFMLVVIVLYFVVDVFLGHLHDNHPDNYFLTALTGYWISTPINCMATGGLFAVICSSNKPAFVSAKKILFNKWVQYPIFILTVTVMLTGINFSTYAYTSQMYAVLFGIVICNLALNKDRIIDLERFKFMGYLGKISYGLYMYHPIIAVFVLNVLLKYNCVNNYIIYVSVFSLTILIASISYHFFEKPFISKKTRFSTLVSGDNAEAIEN